MIKNLLKCKKSAPERTFETLSARMSTIAFLGMLDMNLSCPFQEWHSADYIYICSLINSIELVYHKDQVQVIYI